MGGSAVVMAYSGLARGEERVEQDCRIDLDLSIVMGESLSGRHGQVAGRVMASPTMRDL